MLKHLTFFIFLIVHVQSHAQSMGVVSHYPASAYVVERLLPFAVEGEQVSKILSVEVTNAPSCSAIHDPYYSKIFHVYCRKPEVFNVSVRVQVRMGEETVLEIKNLSVAIQRAPDDGSTVTAFGNGAGS